MKIAVVANAFPPRGQGGAATVAALQVEMLQQRGHEVRVFGITPSLAGRPAWQRLFFHLGDLVAKKELVDEIVTWKPDILLSHNLTGCGFGTPSAIRMKGIPWVHVLHDVQLFEPSGQIIEGEPWIFLRRLWRNAWATLRRRWLGVPDVVISPTKWLADLHHHFGFFQNITVRIIPNPLPHIAQVVAKRVKTIDVIYVGRLDLDKGIDVLVEAWKRLGENRSALHLVGDGTRRSQLEQESGVVVHGPRSHEETLALLQQSRIIAVPSLVWENQPSVILEGIACGCAVIASAVGGIPETLRDAGRLVSAGDVSAWERALRELLVTIPSEDVAKQADILSNHDPNRVGDLLEVVLVEAVKNK